MKTFKIDDHVEIVCEWKKTRTAFKHEAVLLVDGREHSRAKICYQNRTWERFEFESVIKKLLEKNNFFGSPSRLESFVNSLKDKQESPFKAVATIAMIGEVFGKDQKEKNDWKARMLKAGLEGEGLIMPDDWNELTEDEKEARLNAAIQTIK